MNYTFAAALERWAGEAAYFVCYLPAGVASEIDSTTEGLRGGFGSVRVQVRIGNSAWRTSIFRDTKRGSYLLLIKKQVRVAERLDVGTQLEVSLELVDF